MWTAAVAVGVALAWAPGVGGVSASAGGVAAPVVPAPPEPGWSLERAEDGLALWIEVPPGWALYAPEPGPVGLPLEVAWLGPDGVPTGQVVRARWPAPRREPGPYGVARVYRERVSVALEPPAPARGGASRALEVRWALCRDALCVPGTSRVVLPPRQPPRR